MRIEMNMNLKKESKEMKKIKKIRKSANQHIDINEEYKKDPKYKTEICKGFLENNSCIYGHKCRFAHGNEELFEKTENHPKYKQKNCKSFFDKGVCKFGDKCHFKHIDLNKVDFRRSSYQFMLQIREIFSEETRSDSISDDKSFTTLSSKSSNCLLSLKSNLLSFDEQNTTIGKIKRLEVFQKIYEEME